MLNKLFQWVLIAFSVTGLGEALWCLSQVPTPSFTFGSSAIYWFRYIQWISCRQHNFREQTGDCKQSFKICATTRCGSQEERNQWDSGGQVILVCLLFSVVWGWLLRFYTLSVKEFHSIFQCVYQFVLHLVVLASCFLTSIFYLPWTYYYTRLPFLPGFFLFSRYRKTRESILSRSICCSTLGARGYFVRCVACYEYREKIAREMLPSLPVIILCFRLYWDEEQYLWSPGASFTEPS